MAFNAANLVVKKSLQEQVRAYTYSTGDDVATAGSGSYFDAATAFLRAGDLIAVTASDGKFLLWIESVSPIPTVSVNVHKIASGVSSFEFLA